MHKMPVFVIKATFSDICGIYGKNNSTNINMQKREFQHIMFSFPEDDKELKISIVNKRK